MKVVEINPHLYQYWHGKLALVPGVNGEVLELDVVPIFIPIKDESEIYYIYYTVLPRELRDLIWEKNESS